MIDRCLLYLSHKKPFCFCRRHPDNIALLKFQPIFPIIIKMNGNFFTSEDVFYPFLQINSYIVIQIVQKVKALFSFYASYRKLQKLAHSILSMRNSKNNSKFLYVELAFETVGLEFLVAPFFAI